jgi:FkbM family methyltransferase
MLESFVKSAFRMLGFDISRRTSVPSGPFDAQKSFLKDMGIAKPVIFDIGAHRGETMDEYRSRFPESVIYCFEPFPGSLELLRKKVGTDPYTKIIPSAVADKPGQRTFYVNAIDATNSLLPVATEGRRYLPKRGATKATIQVEVTSIDEFIKEYRVGKIDILKMDIQGGEFMALNGAAKTLKEQQIPVIYTEIDYIPHYENQLLFSELWNFLNQFGYSLFDIYNIVKAPNGQILRGDALFVSTDVRRNVIDRYTEEP